MSRISVPVRGGVVVGAELDPSRLLRRDLRKVLVPVGDWVALSCSRSLSTIPRCPAFQPELPCWAYPECAALATVNWAADEHPF